MKKKTVKKDIDLIMKNNSTIIDVMNDFSDKYNFTAEDVFTLEVLQKHLQNMNVVFKQMKDI